VNNLEKNGFKRMPVIDDHLHIIESQPIEKTVRAVANILEYYQYERVNLCLCHEMHREKIDPFQNIKGFYVKSKLNKIKPDRVYTYGSILHYHDARDTAEGYLQQVKKLMAMGAEGIKLLDGKPNCRKELARPLDDPIFDLMYDYLEENQIPIVSHVGDPEANWDINKISENALKRGWFYDETYPTMQQLRAEVDGILSKFPKLKLCLAHFYFWGEELEKTKAFFDRWDNVTFDLTPGGEMFVGFSKRPAEWRQFFIDYADRICYGTDTHGKCYDELDSYEERMACGYRINLTKRMLEKSEPFESKLHGRLVPLALDDETLAKIYYTNFLRDAGAPREIKHRLVAEEAAALIAAVEAGQIPMAVEDPALELENAKEMMAYFKEEAENE
jgi:hypothetical protein